MNFRLPMDENGIIVELKDVDEADEQKMKAAKSNVLDPTSSPFNKYFTYNKEVGFVVDSRFFDHAEYKGKSLSYDEYLKKYAQDADNHVNDAINYVRKCVDSKETYEEMLQRAKDDCVELKHAITANDDDKNEIITKQRAEHKILTKYAMSMTKPHDELDRWIERHKKYLESTSINDSLSFAKVESVLTNIDNQINDETDLDKLLSLSKDAQNILEYMWKNIDDANKESLVEFGLKIQADLINKIKQKLIDADKIMKISENAEKIFNLSKDKQNELH